MGRTDQDEDLPWDPLWAYVLGEDDEEGRDQQVHVDKRRSPDYNGREESRDTGEGLSIRRSFWSRRRRDSAPADCRDDDPEEKWQWELDTSTFLFDSEKSAKEAGTGKAEVTNGKKQMNKKNEDSSWIGSVWREQKPKIAASLRKTT